MTRDKGEEAPIPADLTEALADDDGAGTAFDKLTPAGRREYIAWIEAAKRPETRAARVTKMIGMLLAGKRRPSE